MAEFKIARIRFRWVGNWTSGYDYIKDDVVRYGAKTYVALKTHTSDSNFYNDLDAVDTQVPPQADPHWELMADGYEWTNNWQTNTFYNVGDIVKKNGLVYICLTPHTSTLDETNFSLDNANWAKYTDGLNWLYNWTTSTSYSINDVVRYKGIIYRCIIAHTSSSDVLNGLEEDDSKWSILHSSDRWTYDWNTSTRYYLNDIVRYGGIVYRCLQDHISESTFTSGLETDINKWQVVHENVEWKGTWSGASVRYKLNDLVKYGANVWVCNTYHTSSANFDETKWTMYIPGFEYENTWDNSVKYQKGDIVNYGGYNYSAITNNVNKTPSVESSDWELLSITYRFREDWSNTVSYLVGDVVRRGGQLYTAILDNTGQETNQPTYWELLIPGVRWRDVWAATQKYVIGDLVSYISTTYRCINTHDSTIVNRPDLDTLHTYWEIYIEGDITNVLLAEGDLRTFGASEVERLPIGADGNVLKTVSGNSVWENFGQFYKVYYVSTDGVDDLDHGLTINAPWRTIRYACENATGPATIFVKTGIFEEALPISIPANVALVGDELRGTTVKPTTGSETSDMFYVRDGSGIRNMTLMGISGVLLGANINGTRRPTGGAFVSLDPGTGPSDESVWIVNRSPYIQNVTTFGTACVGLKIDGSLHDGGNRSAVANDFTQVLSDGIGAWVTNLGLTELVSVFTYYNHIGYLSEYGGKIRATNGNNSYGTYGAVAEGYDLTEDPVTADVDNRTLEAQVFSSVVSNGQILKLEYSNAGQDYSTSSFDFSGAGVNASAFGDEYRDGAVYEARVITPGDSSAAGGGSYVVVKNNAQLGDTTSITIAASDQNLSSNYVNMRVFITDGTGTGQYGYIQSYDSVSKIAVIYKESTSTIGWDHINPGTPIEAALDTTTVYSIEPRVSFSSPLFQSSNASLIDLANWSAIAYGQGTYVAIASGSNVSNTATNGTNWSPAANLPISSTWLNLAHSPVANKFITNNSSGVYYYSSDTGASWLGGATLTGDGTRSYIVKNSTGFAAISGGGSTRTNLITYSSDFSNANWSKADSSITVDSTTAPDGTTTADFLYEASTTANHRINQAVSTTNGLTYTFSVFVKASTRHVVKIELSNGGWSTAPRVTFNLNTGSVQSSTGSPLSSGITAINNGWYRIWITATADATTTGGAWIMLGNSDSGEASSYAGDGTSGLWIWGAQAEVANYASGYIPTTSSTATSNSQLAVSTNGTTWTTLGSPPNSTTWTHLAHGGNDIYVAIAGGSTNVASYSISGAAWSSATMPTTTTWASVAYGNGRFVAIANSGTAAAYSLNGSTWTASTLPASVSWTSVSYGQGMFVAVASGTATAATSPDGVTWTSRTLSASGAWTDVVFGNTNSVGAWVAVSNGPSINANLIKTGATTQARADVTSGRVSTIKIWEPGSGYTSAPTITVTDPNKTSSVYIRNRVGNGVLGNPSFTNRGTGYKRTSTTVAVSGNGYADIYQLGEVLRLKNCTLIPNPGDNLNISGINDLTYKVVTVTLISGSAPYYNIRLTVSPNLDIEESPENATQVTIRRNYSQVRMTGHDFLDIGAGNVVNSNYPNIPQLLLAPENEILEKDGGRVFYTSTDQDGNFRVGELFKVEQSTGTVTISSSFFQLSGLEELSLGGVSIGGSAVVIREFSTDATFSADSNNIVPTQKAIKAYMERRISGGGSDATCALLIAGVVRIGGIQSIRTTTGVQIDMPNKVNITKGFDGSMLAMTMFMDSFGNDSGDSRDVR